MAFQGILTFLILLGGFWLVWKFLISPRIPDKPQEQDYEKILREKLEELEKLRAENKSVRKEVDVTREIEALDREIEKTLQEIKKFKK